MFKKLIAALLLVCMLSGMLCACQSKKITAEEAYQIVLNQLDALAKSVEETHIHPDTYQGKPCFNIYVTVAGHSVLFVISENGKLLHKGAAEHSH